MVGLLVTIYIDPQGRCISNLNMMCCIEIDDMTLPVGVVYYFSAF